MKKDDLIKLKQHIASFSIEEQRIRDEYLRKIATGELEGPMTGYPTIDMPQLAHYDMEKYHEEHEGENITYALLRQNADNLDSIALEYFKNKITYKEFFERIGDLMKALQANGVKKGDSVICCLPGMPEGMTCVYALAGLGAIGVFMPPYVDTQSMISDIKFGNTKIFIIMDALYEAYKDSIDCAIREAGIEKAVIVPTLNSSPLKKIKKSKQIPEGFISYDDFIREGEEVDLPRIVPYEKDMPAAVVYSSGTTGKLKGILLSHDTINNSADSYHAFGFDINKGQVVYQVIPPFASTGLIASGTTALYYGCTLYQDPRLVPETFSKNIGLHKVNWAVGTTSLFEGLDTVRKKKILRLLAKTNILDYRSLRNVYIGGTLSTEKNKAKLNEILKGVGCPTEAKRSYGNCENGSIVTAEKNEVKHHADSVGVPIPGVKIMIVDEEGVELPYYQRGEITVKTNCGMLDYYNRPVLSEQVFFENEAGTETYKHTGDIGYITPTGDLIYEGRANDVSVVGGLEFFNFDIKNVILTFPEVYDAEVMTNKVGILCVHIQFYDGLPIDEHKKIREIQQALYNKFGDLRCVPEHFKIRKSFPLANSTKRNMIELTKEAEGFIYMPNTSLTKAREKELTL